MILPAATAVARNESSPATGAKDSGQDYVDNALRPRDRVNFMTSDEFVPLVNLSETRPLRKLWNCLTFFDDTMFTRAFTHPQIGRVLESFGGFATKYLVKQVTMIVRVLHLLTARVPEFAELLPTADCFEENLHDINKIVDRPH